MNAIQVYLLQIAVTVFLSAGATAILRPSLRRVLTELCGTPERANFWVVFSGIMLTGLPLAFSLGFNPLKSPPAMLFFSAAGQLRANLLGFLLALACIGCAVSFFALVAPRPSTK